MKYAAHRLACAMILMLLFPLTVMGATMQTDITLHFSATGMQSFAGYHYYRDGEAPPQRFEQYHVIVNGGVDHSSSLFTDVWSNNLTSHITPEPPLCYNARMTITVHSGYFACCTTEQSYYREAGATCFHGPPPPPDVQCGGGGPYEDCSPIVINFEGGYELTGADAPVSFDIQATGTPALIGWTAAGSDEAFLWMDRNGNQSVDDGAELFGNASRLQGGILAANGFEALRELDSNHDSMISSADSAWKMLRLWRDMNHNGRSEANEIATLSSKVTGIGTRYRESRRRDRHGNEFRYQSLVWLRGDVGRPVVRPVYDIFFMGVAR